MTILLVKEIDLENYRDFQRSLADGDTGFRTFRVITDSISHTEPEIIVASDGTTTIPAGLSLFPGSSTAQCYLIHPYRDKLDGKKWLVRCEYKSILNQQEISRATVPIPYNRATEISGQSRTIMQPVRRMLRTVPYKLWSEAGPGATWEMGNACNSGNDSIDPPIQVAVTEWEINCEKNVQYLPTWVLDPDSPYANGVNNADQVITINGVTRTIKKGTGKLSNLTFSNLKRENGYAFITISWNCTVKGYRPLFGAEADRFGPWDTERRDEGKRIYNIGKKLWENIRDKSGQSVQDPVPFDGAGGPLATTSAIEEGDMWWIAYRPHGERVDFSIMPWA